MVKFTAGLLRRPSATMGKAIDGACVKPEKPTDSESRVLRNVLRGEDVTQPAIVRATGLSQQTVSRLVTDLTDKGALRPGRKLASKRRGQPSVTVEVTRDYAYSLGIGLMTDALSLVLMDFSGTVVDHAYFELPVMSRKAVFASIAQAREGFLQREPHARERLVGAGIGILGPCLDGKSRFNPPRALDEWAMVPIDDLFAEQLDMPCWVEGDGNAAAVGESFLGWGRTHANFVYIYIAAGLGGGIITDHRLLRGSHGNSGEIGRMLPWRSFHLPTLETLLQSLRKCGVEVASVSEMLAKFDPDWPGVGEWVSNSREPFSLLCSAISALVDPEVIVFGGRLPASLADKLLPTIELFDDARREQPRPLPRLIASQMSFDACAVGAAMLPLEKTFYTTML